MLKVIEVPVLAVDITKGIQKSSSSCAISLALKRVFPEATWFLVFGGNNVLVDNKRISVMAGDTFKVQKFINVFDVNKTKAVPFSFRLLQIVNN